jgi:DNA-binding NtrC family response regulator
MEAAARLGWGRNTLTRKIQEHGLDDELRKSVKVEMAPTRR